LLPDLKWDGKTKETLYLLAICFDRNIKSLRDLTDSHLDLLKNIQEKGVNAIEERYGIKKTQLRIYIHYQPSFYHFHVHFTYLKHDAPGIYCEKSHLLSGVINNIQLIPDYYQKSTLSFTVREADRLFQKYNEELSIKKVKVDDQE
jgi:m7GpppX diphosphatase